MYKGVDALIKRGDIDRHPIDRKMLREWVETFHPESIEEFRKSLLWRINEGMFWIPKYEPLRKDGRISNH